MDPVQAAGERIERLLDELDGSPVAEELVHALMELYGAGLARVLELADEPMVARLAKDELVRGLLILHDLHPQSTVERVTAALEEVRPYLGSHAGDVEFIGIEDGLLHLRLTGSCDGCPSSAVTAQQAIERTVRDAAPELTGIEVEGATGPGGRPLLPIVDCPVPR
ncbi:NifU family protein [Amycolatopsis sp. GM8]|uniref:NifU family protein n=1 Tax=Amycolatopsis sp. GM8 TaxID=2896530 RepID=UPI001F1B35CA|nr:NifU family protein [Amycolatopsis sp. GM8]